MLTLRRAKLHSGLTGAGRLTSPAALSAHSCPSDTVPGVHSRRGGRQAARCMPSKQEHWSNVQDRAKGTHEASGAHSCSVSRTLQARASTCAAKQCTGALTGQEGPCSGDYWAAGPSLPCAWCCAVGATDASASGCCWWKKPSGSSGSPLPWPELAMGLDPSSASSSLCSRGQAAVSISKRKGEHVELVLSWA